MRRGFLWVVAIVLACSSAFGSQPGQPLDCGDWVPLQPGYSCTQVIAPDCGQSPFCLYGSQVVSDNEGRLLRLQRIGNEPHCTGSLGRFKTEVVALTGAGEVVLGYFWDRCRQVDATTVERDSAEPRTVGDLSYSVTFDAVNGRLLLPLNDVCMFDDNGRLGYCPGAGWWLAAIGGFATLFDVTESYVPTGAELSIRVPAQPEGLRTADHFDTYWGRVSDLPDFTKAQPMACNYPATPPAVGDYLTVTDISPSPTPGTANYTVTAVTYQGQTRYGRKKIGDTMSGRDPAMLPGCVQDH